MKLMDIILSIYNGVMETDHHAETDRKMTPIERRGVVISHEQSRLQQSQADLTRASTTLKELIKDMQCGKIP